MNISSGNASTKLHISLLAYSSMKQSLSMLDLEVGAVHTSRSLVGKYVVNTVSQGQKSCT